MEEVEEVEVAKSAAVVYQIIDVHNCVFMDASVCLCFCVY